jgi:serine/threonine-protein kinase
MSLPLHIENFEIIGRLGQGGMATVWKARQASLDRMVAIKVLAATFITDPADVARFREEARAAGKLKHPGIVQVYDANFKDGAYYFVMELVDGYTVGEWIRRKGRLEEHDALTVAESVIAALDYAWSQFGIIHCDIKSDNIMVDADGTVKVTDLGLARAISSMQAREPEQEVLGTPAFMSPEQVTGQSDLDCRADIYALGATIYHMVTGHLLFAKGGTDDEIMQKQLVGTVPSPAREVSGLTPGFVLLLAKMLAKDRKYRPQDWKQVLADIRRVREHRHPLPPEPPTGASTIFIDPDDPDSPHRRVLHASGSPATEPVRSEAVPESGGARVWLWSLAVAAFLVSAWVFFRNRQETEPPGQAGSGPTLSAATDESCYKNVLAYVVAHPMDFTGGVARLDDALKRYPASWYAQQARLERDRLQNVYCSEIQTVCADLDNKARELVTSGKDYEAVRLMELYRGRYAAETAAWRREQAQLLRGGGGTLRPIEPAPPKPVQQQPPPPRGDLRAPTPPPPARALSPGEGLQQAARMAVRSDLVAAQTLTTNLLREHADWAQNPDFVAWRALLDQTLACQRAVAQTFAAEKGKTLSLRLATGEVQGVVGEVKRDRIRLTVAGGEEQTISIDDLDASERIKRLARLGAGGDSARFLKGLWAARAHAYERAQDLFKGIPPPAVGAALASAIDSPDR